MSATWMSMAVGHMIEIRWLILPLRFTFGNGVKEAWKFQDAEVKSLQP